MENKERKNKVAVSRSPAMICSACDKLKRENFHLQIKLDGAEDAIRNLVEKIEQLENLKVYDGLDAQFLE